MNVSYSASKVFWFHSFTNLKEIKCKAELLHTTYGMANVPSRYGNLLQTFHFLQLYHTRIKDFKKPPDSLRMLDMFN